VQQRLVRVSDLLAEADRNERLHRRKLIGSTLADIAGGSHALSELDFIKLVVRQFNLPEPDRQVARRDGKAVADGWTPSGRRSGSSSRSTGRRTSMSSRTGTTWTGTTISNLAATAS
jgi:hypothetical protein